MYRFSSMKDYVELNCEVSPYSEEAGGVLISLLDDLGYEGFLEEGRFLKAYIPCDLFSAEKLKAKTKVNFSFRKIEAKDWNLEWERNFQPVVIGDKVCIRGSFHKKSSCEYDIVIDPKMSFGTGHSPTTALMVKWILELNAGGKRVLDMGCGTSILGILASKRGAKEVVGIDPDEWAYKNSIENASLNNVGNLKIHLGDASLLKEMGKFDIILANINENVLLIDIPKYAYALAERGDLILSGFYLADLARIDGKAKEFNLRHVSYAEDSNWVAVRYVKG